MSDTKLREKADALIAFTLQGPRFIAWVEAVTDSIAPAPEKVAKVECVKCGKPQDPNALHCVAFATTDKAHRQQVEYRYTCQPAPPATEKRSTDPDCGPYTHHWDFGFCHTCKKPGRDQGDAPATEKAVCPNCGEITGRSHSRYQGPGPDKWICQPAQPEPAAPEMPPMPNAVHNLVLWCQMLSASQYGQGFRSQIKADLDAFTDWWRTHSQPVAHPFKAGFKPDSMRHFAEYVRDNWHYFGTDTAGLAHQFLQEMAAQPVAVGMTEELSMVLLRAEYGATEDERNPNLRDGYVARLKSAIETVRQQAAQVKL